MIHVEVKERGRYVAVPNGPFPISQERFMEVIETSKGIITDNPLDSGYATAAREALRHAGLSSFDCLALGNAVAMIANGSKFKIQSVK